MKTRVKFYIAFASALLALVYFCAAATLFLRAQNAYQIRQKDKWAERAREAERQDKEIQCFEKATGAFYLGFGTYIRDGAKFSIPFSEIDGAWKKLQDRKEKAEKAPAIYKNCLKENKVTGNEPGAASKKKSYACLEKAYRY